MKNEEIEQAIAYAEKILERAKEDDVLYKMKCLENNESEKATGDSFMVFHISSLVKILKDLKSR